MHRWHSLCRAASASLEKMRLQKISLSRMLLKRKKKGLNIYFMVQGYFISMKWVSSENCKWIEASFWSPGPCDQFTFYSLCDYVFLIFRFPSVMNESTFVRLVSLSDLFPQGERPHSHNLIHLNEVFGLANGLSQFPGIPLGQKTVIRDLPPLLRFTGCGHMVGAFGSPRMAMKNHISFFLRQEEMHCGGQHRPHMLSGFLFFPWW